MALIEPINHWLDCILNSPEALGTYQVHAGTLPWINGKTTQFCHQGDTGVYQIYLTATGELAFVLQKDACGVRNPPSTLPQLFDPISPEGRSLAFPTGTFVGDSYSMTFKTDGTYRFGTVNGQVITTGTYAIKANTLRWLQDTYCHSAATYVWTYQDNRLTFILNGTDSCKDRQTALTGSTYGKR